VDTLASDDDRERATEQLTDAAADGRLTVDELSERLDLVHAARTDADLEAALDGLPAVDDHGPGYPAGAITLAVLLVLVPIPFGRLAAIAVALMLLRNEVIPRRRFQLRMWAIAAGTLELIVLATYLLLAR
jgi:hypothetical protein